MREEEESNTVGGEGCLFCLPHKEQRKDAYLAASVTACPYCKIEKLEGVIRRLVLQNGAILTDIGCDKESLREYMETMKVFKNALHEISRDIPARRQNTPVSYLQGIARAALECDSE